MSDAQDPPVETPPGDLPKLPVRTQKGIDAIRKLMGKTPMELIPECPNTRWSTNLVEEFRSLVNAVKKQRSPEPFSFDDVKSFLLKKTQEHDIKRRTSLEASDVRAAKYLFFGNGQGAGEDIGDGSDTVPGFRNKRTTREPSVEAILQPTNKRFKTRDQGRETSSITPTPFAPHTSLPIAESSRDSITVDPQAKTLPFSTVTARSVQTDSATMDSNGSRVTSHVPVTQNSGCKQPPKSVVNTSLPSGNESDLETDLNNIIRRCENSIDLLIAKAGQEQASRVERWRLDLNDSKDLLQQCEEEVVKFDKASTTAKDNLRQATERLGTTEGLFAALENAVGTLDAPPETYLARVGQSRDKAIATHRLASQSHTAEFNKLSGAKTKRDEAAKRVGDLSAVLEAQEGRQARDAETILGAETFRKLLGLGVGDLRQLFDTFPGFIDGVDRMAKNKMGNELGQERDPL